TNQLLRFHTDRCDVVALFCIRQAKSGGLSQLCSSPAVHNEMLRHRPELCGALYEPVWRSRFGEEDATGDSAYPLPVWGVREGHEILWRKIEAGAMRGGIGQTPTIPVG